MEFQSYPYRWVILLVFCCLEISSVMLWVSFAPISDVTQHYFEGNSYASSITGVNMLANVFLIFYAPGTVLGFLLMAYGNLKTTFVIAASITVAGSLLRYLSSLYLDSLGAANAYWLMFLGQALAAIAQPSFLNMPPAIALAWFPTSERDIATTIGAMVSPIALAVGQIIPVALASETETSTGEYDVSGMEDLLLTEFLLTVLPLLLTIIFFRDAPPTPPSYAASLKAKMVGLTAAVLLSLFHSFSHPHFLSTGPRQCAGARPRP